MTSNLYVGVVTHRRRHPVRHAFRYPLALFCLDLDELPDLDRHLRLFSWNRPNLFSYFDRDHMDGGPAITRDTLPRWLVAQGIDLAGGRILLVTQPRIFQYVFNPVSFYYCHDRGGALRAIVAEVDNTFGERHLYLLDERTREGAGGASLLHRTRKVMHVSPFTGMDAGYRFRFGTLGDRLMIAIREEEGGAPVLDAAIAGRRVALSDRTLAWMLVRFPLQTARVTLGIHAQALRLWWKRVPFHSQPAPSPEQRAQRDALRGLVPGGVRP